MNKLINFIYYLIYKIFRFVFNIISLVFNCFKIFWYKRKLKNKNIEQYHENFNKIIDQYKNLHISTDTKKVILEFKYRLNRLSEILSIVYSFLNKRYFFFKDCHRIKALKYWKVSTKKILKYTLVDSVREDIANIIRIIEFYILYSIFSKSKNNNFLDEIEKRLRQTIKDIDQLIIIEQNKTKEIQVQKDILSKSIDSLIYEINNKKFFDLKKAIEEKKIINKFIILDTNIFLTSKWFLIPKELIKYNNTLVIVSPVLDELEKLKEKKRKTEVPINEILNFVKSGLKKGSIISKNIGNKYFYDRYNNNYADSYFSKILEKNKNYYFMTADNSLYIRLYERFSNRILEPYDFYIEVDKINILRELNKLKNELNNISDLTEIEFYRNKLLEIKAFLKNCISTKDPDAFRMEGIEIFLRYNNKSKNKNLQKFF